MTEAGVERLVDVRAVASSRRRGFSKRALWDALADAGIAYEHWPELGNPKPFRDLYRAGRKEEGREAYRAHLLASGDLERFADSLDGTPTCLLCLEADVEDCHRVVILEELARRDPDLEVVLLR